MNIHLLRAVAPPVQARSIAPLATSPGERRTIIGDD